MVQNDTTDFFAAFAIGAVLGAGATLLLRGPGRRRRTRRVAKDLKPYRKRMQKSAKRARKGLEQTAGATADLREELGAASRTVVRDFQDELAELLAAAREEIAHTVDDQITEARKALKGSVDRLRDS